MTFLPQYSQMQYVQLQISEIQNKKQVVMCRDSANSREMYRVEVEYQQQNPGASTTDIENEPYYKWLEQQQSLLQTQSSGLDGQLQSLEAMYDNLKSQLNTGIKQSCGMALGGN